MPDASATSGDAAPSPRGSKDLATLTVTGSRTVSLRQGGVAIVLETAQLGPLAFEADRRTMAALRREIATADAFLRYSSGSVQIERAAATRAPARPAGRTCAENV